MEQTFALVYDFRGFSSWYMAPGTWVKQCGVIESFSLHERQKAEKWRQKRDFKKRA